MGCREDALPASELLEAEQQAGKADLAICLGTSLQITPACNIPVKTAKAGPFAYLRICHFLRDRNLAEFFPQESVTCDGN